MNIIAPVCLAAGTDPQLDKYYTGNELYNRKVYSAAADAYQDFLKVSGSNEKAGQARLGLALCQYMLGRYVESEALLKALITDAKVGDPIQLHLLLGQCQAKRKALAAAETTFQEGLKAAGSVQYRKLTLVSLADLLFRQQRWNDAAEAADNAMKAGPDGDAAERVGYQRAYSLYKLGKAKEASDVVNAAGLPKGAVLAHQSNFLLGECQRELGDFDKAAEAYAAAAVKEEGAFAAEALYRLGYSRYMMKRYDEAEEALNRSLKESSDGQFADEARIYLGRAMLEKQQFAASVKVFRLVSQNTNSAVADEATLWLGKAYQRQGKPAEAVTVFEDALPRFKRNDFLGDILFEYACALIELGRHADASATFVRLEREARDWREFPESLRMHAFCEHWQTNYPASLKLCDNYLQARTNAPLPEVVFLKAENVFLMNPEKPEKALELYQDFIAHYPSDSRRESANLRLAQILHKQGDWSAALKLATPFSGKASESKAFSQIKFMAGDSSFRKGSWDEAISNLVEFIAKADKAAPNVDIARLELGIAQSRKGDKVAAIEAFSDLITKCPDSPQVPVALAEEGRLKYEMKAGDQGGKAFQRLVDEFAESPQRAVAEYYLGWLALDGKKDEAAAAHFGALAGAPSAKRGAGRGQTDDAIVADSVLQLGLLKLRLEQFAEAQQLLLRYSRVYTNSPKCDEAVYAAGVAMARQKQWEPAIETFKSLQTRFPASGLLDAAVYEWAWAERSRGRLANGVIPEGSKQAAIKQYEYLLAHFPKSPLAERARFELAELTFDAGKFDQTIAQLKESIATAKQAETKEQAMYRLGWAYVSKGDSEEAAKAFEALLAEYPESDRQADAHYQAAECRLKMRDVEAANAHFLAVVKGKGVDANIAESALLRYGETLALLKQWNESLEAYGQFGRKYPESKWIQRARFGRGRALESLQKYPLAIEEYRKVADGKTVDELGARSQFQIGECLFAQQKYDDALQELSRVQVHFASKEWSPQAVLEMGRVLEAKGDKTGAMTYFREVIQKYPQHEAAVAAKRLLDALR